MILAWFHMGSASGLNVPTALNFEVVALNFGFKKVAQSTPTRTLRAGSRLLA
jgi:hypothetical protein